MATPESDTLRETPLRALHERLGARLVDFAGWAMPVTYPGGAVAEHLHTRRHASLFDVSHMGVVELHGADAAAALERLTPSAVADLASGRQRYVLLTNERGGIHDDVMVANTGAGLRLVVNAARRAHDLGLLRDGLPGVQVTERADLGLLALQGPEAADVLADEDPAVAGMRFMDARTLRVAGVEAWATRSGYTGEDGFELVVAADHLPLVAERLLADERVAPAGLGARDSLRLEAGLCLYGADLDETTSPVEAGLAWTIPKARREGADFPGAERIRDELAGGVTRRRVGLRPEGRKPVRAGAALTGDDGTHLGGVTSGGWGPSLGAPVAMGYVQAAHATDGGRVVAHVRGTPVPCRIADLPFVPHGYRRSRSRT